MRSPIAARALRCVLLVGVLGIVSACTPAWAGKLDQIDTSLQWIPADAAAYHSWLRNREQFEAVANSRAVAKIKAMPALQMAWEAFQKEAENPDSVPAKIVKALEEPQVREVIDLAADMFSNEVFVYADEDTIGFIQLMQECIGAVQYGPIFMMLSGEMGEADPGELQLALLLNTLNENRELLKIPHVIVGFKLSDTNLARKQLAKLEVLASIGIAVSPLPRNILKNTSVEGNEYLTLALDGSLIPWDEIPVHRLKRVMDNPDDADALLDALKKMTLTISLGIRDDYLLLSIGASNDCLAGLGKGDSLIDRPEFKRLAPFADKRLTSIGYTSKALNTVSGTQPKDIDGFRDALFEWLPAFDLDPDLQARIRKDATALAADIKTAIPEPGASLSFSFLGGRGQETYSFDWAENRSLDGSKPLELLKHVGGNPILAVVSRGKYSTSGYDTLVKWIEVGYGYVEDLALPRMDPSNREEYDQAAKLFFPLIKRLHLATREMLLPALANGQAALVLDAKLKSRHFIQALPPTEQALPMIEPALVFGVSDAALLRKAMGEYMDVLDDALDAIRQINPDMPVDFRIPRPTARKTEAGTIYSYALPREWGVDGKIAPNAGLSDSVAVLSISPAHSQRLLTPNELESAGVLTDGTRARASAAYFNWAGLVEAATPWVELAARAIVAETMELSDPDGDQPQMAFVLDQVKTVLEVLKCLRGVTSETYFDDGVLVTHTITEVRDLEE